MSYICEFCGTRPENCSCSVDLTEPRLESELVVADNIMAVENPVIKKSAGVVDAPSPADFLSLLVKLEEEEKYNTSPSSPISSINLLPIPKLQRQTNNPSGISLPEEDIKPLSVYLFPEEPQIPDSDIDSQYCENCYGFICECNQSKVLEENQTVSPEQIARENYEMARDCGTYEYDKFCMDFPDDNEELIKCPTCEEMINSYEPYGMCYSCFTIEQRLYPDDIAMDLRYNSDIDRDSF